MKKTLCGLVAVCLSLCALAAQAPVPLPTPVSPVLTEVEQLKLDLVRTRTALATALVRQDECKAEIGQAAAQTAKIRTENAQLILSAESVRLVLEIEAAHPGYTFDLKAGTLTPRPK